MMPRRIIHNAENNGLPEDLDNLLDENETFTVLIFEDFGTSGLQGNPKSPYPPKERGKIISFTFSVPKEGRIRNLWGLGKNTFFWASRVNTVD